LKLTLVWEISQLNLTYHINKSLANRLDSHAVTHKSEFRGCFL
jgi:hypothetical protein